MRVLYHFFYKLQEKLKKSINIRFPTTIYAKKMRYTTLWILIFLLLYFICAQQALGFLYFLMVLVLVLPGNTRCKNFGWYPYHYFFNCIVYYLPFLRNSLFYLSSSQLWRWQHPISAFVLWFTSNVSCKRSSVCVTNI